MKHLGDITKINWFDVAPVDVVTGGSPCQDLSVAGKRAGLSGERSGLYMEQIRCVKELRQADVQRGRTGQFIRPRFMVWENVPGAFSSGKPKGADFAAVIEEIIKVAEPGTAVHVRVPDRGWNKSGCYYAEDGSWSIAYRVHDAQYWGVPQRRKRIALLADFGGLSAAEILFDPKLRRETGGGDQDAAVGDSGAGPGREVQVEHKGLSGDFEPSGEERKEAAGAVKGSTGGAIPINMMLATRGKALGRGTGFGIGEEGEPQFTISAAHSHAVYADAIPIHDKATRFNGGGPTRNSDGAGNGLGVGNVGDPCPTLSCGDHHMVATYQTVTGPLMANSHPGSYCGQDAYTDMLVAHTLKAKGNCDFREDSETYPVQGNVVRRLTPLECERLQGYPDGWTNIGDWKDSKGKTRKEADSPRYKALGNSIALPFWCWLAKRISAQYERDITMGSLFDGIGGFPYAFEKCGGKAVWASEIEEFPIAVTKTRFPEQTEVKSDG